MEWLNYRVEVVDERCLRGWVEKRPHSWYQVCCSARCFSPRLISHGWRRKRSSLTKDRQTGLYHAASPLQEMAPVGCCRSGKVYERKIRWFYFGALPAPPPLTPHDMKLEFQRKKTVGKRWVEYQWTYKSQNNECNRPIAHSSPLSLVS